MGCCRSQTQAVQYVDDPTSALLKEHSESPVRQGAGRRMHKTERVSNLQVNTPSPGEDLYQNTPIVGGSALSLSGVGGGLAASPLRDGGLDASNV